MPWRTFDGALVPDAPSTTEAHRDSREADRDKIERHRCAAVLIDVWWECCGASIIQLAGQLNQSRFQRDPDWIVDVIEPLLADREPATEALAIQEITNCWRWLATDPDRHDPRTLRALLGPLRVCARLGAQDAVRSLDVVARGAHEHALRGQPHYADPAGHLFAGFEGYAIVVEAAVRETLDRPDTWGPPLLQLMSELGRAHMRTFVAVEHLLAASTLFLNPENDDELVISAPFRAALRANLVDVDQPNTRSDLRLGCPAFRSRATPIARMHLEGVAPLLWSWLSAPDRSVAGT